MVPLFITARCIFRQATVTENVANVTLIDDQASAIDAVVVGSGVCDVRRWWTAIDCEWTLSQDGDHVYMHACV